MIVSCFLPKCCLVVSTAISLSARGQPGSEGRGKGICLVIRFYLVRLHLSKKSL